MEITMVDDKLTSPAELKMFLAGTQSIELKIGNKERRQFIAETLKRMHYFQLKRADKSLVRAYLLRVSHYSRQQLTRLIHAYPQNKKLERKSTTQPKFATRYTQADKLLLVKTDQYHQTLNGGATKKLFERAYHVFKDASYIRLANISISHIYNLRKSDFYQRQRFALDKTKHKKTHIGERRKPIPNGKPGYIRIDTVHQGDLDKQKGVYHINAVDEVTQFEVILSVEKISEQYLIPILEMLIDAFPFIIIGFHSDNGSEYVNKSVAKLLNKLFIEFTKSRARRSNDNALVESKNGSIVRKILGYIHIPQKHAPLINEFNVNYLIPYINFHRPCFFATDKIDKKGKVKKCYHYQNMMTPYEKLKSLENANQFLKVNKTFEELDQLAMQCSDLEAAKKMSDAQSKLFQKIFSA
jgi:transposase InsO family protein